MSETAFLTPSVIALLGQLSTDAAPDYTPAVQRRALNGAMAALGWSVDPEAASATIIELPSGAAVHIFRPTGTGSATLPWIVYMHGGSFFAGGAESHGPLACKLAEVTGCAVALVDYRLAPEHIAPAALDDCEAAVRYLAAHASELCLSSSRIALLGDSAGGYLAASTVQRLLEVDLPLSLLVLINPMIGPNREDDSIHAFDTGFFATAEDFDAGWRAYVPSRETSVASVLSPSDGFPETLVITNEADPVRDQGEGFAEQLSLAGVPVTLLRARGLIHAAWLFPKVLPEAEMLMAVIGGAMSARLQS